MVCTQITSSMETYYSSIINVSHVQGRVCHGDGKYLDVEDYMEVWCGDMYWLHPQSTVTTTGLYRFQAANWCYICVCRKSQAAVLHLSCPTQFHSWATHSGRRAAEGLQHEQTHSVLSSRLLQHERKSRTAPLNVILDNKIQILHHDAATCTYLSC